MGVSVVGGSTSSGAGLTPFDPAFGYNFPSERTGQNVTLDMQSNIPAGTYTIEGRSNFRSVPRTVQLLNSSNTVVGSATLTVLSEGSYGSNNSGQYSGTVVASQGFSKIKFSGSSTGSPVTFSGTAPTAPTYHIKLSPGVRDLTSVSLADLFISDPSTLTYTNMPTSMPAGSGNVFMTFFYDGKTYALTSTFAPGGNFTSGNNEIKIYAWNHVTGSWSSSLGSINPSALGMNSYAVPGTTGNFYASVYPFKNGKIIFKYDYWFNSGGTNSRPQLRFFTFDVATSTFAASVNYDSMVTGTIGSAAYNPTEDAWYVMSRAVYNSQGGYYETTDKIWKFKNDFGLERMNFVNNISNDSGAHIIMCQDAASPKFIAMGNEQNNQSTYRAVWYGSWSPNGTYSGSSYDLGNASSGGAYYPMWVNQNKTVTVNTTLFGQSSILAVNSANNQLTSWGGPYTFPNAQITNAAEIGYPNFNQFASKSPVFPGTVYQRWTIQPINSTQTAVVISDTDFTGGFGTFGVRATPLPSATV